MGKDRVVYRAINFGFYPAEILSVRGDGTLDLEIFSLSDKPLMRISKVKLAPDRAICQPGEAFVGDLPPQ